ncbi:MAG: hypothetical protein ACR2OR_01915 [Hyphomicrobiales bacterium]
MKDLDQRYYLAQAASASEAQIQLCKKRQSRLRLAGSLALPGLAIAALILPQWSVDQGANLQTELLEKIQKTALTTSETGK